MGTRVVTVKLTDSEHRLAKELCVNGSLLSVSDVLRTALMELGTARRKGHKLISDILAERAQHEPRLRRQLAFPAFEQGKTILEEVKPGRRRPGTGKGNTKRKKK